VIEQDVELASAVSGDDLKFTKPLLPVDPVAEAWADKIMRNPGAQAAVLINPGAGWGAKRWPVDRYAAVARGLSQRGYRVLVNAGPGEEPLADAIVKGTAGAAIPLATSLEQLLALTRRIALCVAGDTGPLHLACALGRPVVGIYGPTDTACCAIRRAAATTPATTHPRPVCSPLPLKTSCAPPPSWSIARQ
jgi:heptosyltransferase-1